MPLHPQIVHLPLALAILLPLLALACAWAIRRGYFTPATWWLVAALQVVGTGTSYLALETGEGDERAAKSVAGKGPVEAHEERAEMFVAGGVAATALALMAVFVQPGLRAQLQLVTVVLMLGNAFLGVRTGESGGELVYVHGAAQGHRLAQNPASSKQGEGLLPTPGQNTSESPFPTDEGEATPPGEEDEPEEADEPEPEE